VKTLIMAAAAALAACPAAAGEAGEQPVRIYLPRTVKIDAAQLALGAISVLACQDAQLAARARAVPMGRAPWPKESLVITRQTILARLVASKVPADRVRFVGAKAVTVTRHERTVGTTRLLEQAEAFLNTSRPEGEDCIYRLVRKPDDAVVPGRGELRYVCKRADTGAAGHVKVVVSIRRDGKQVALREVLYKRMYAVRRAVTVKPVPAGAPLTKQNVEIQTAYVSSPPAGNWQEPFGLLARRRLSAGAVIRPGMAAKKRPALLIKRNQMIRLRVQGAGFLITAVGQALQEGRPGDFIKVRNVDSKRVITGRVAFDGVVEPVIPEAKK